MVKSLEQVNREYRSGMTITTGIGTALIVGLGALALDYAFTEEVTPTDLVYIGMATVLSGVVGAGLTYIAATSGVYDGIRRDTEHREHMEEIYERIDGYPDSYLSKDNIP